MKILLLRNAKTIQLLSILFGITFLGVQCESEDPVYNDLNNRTTAVFNPNLKYGTLHDIDGNIYKTIKIGNQVWMAENLRTVRYRNGDSIPNIIDSALWGTLASGAYCSYNNTTNLDTIATYGYLYNWYAISDIRDLAPHGWRIPTISDWQILIEYLGGDAIAANKLKEAGDIHWADAFESDNESGFTALPGGIRYKNYNTQYLRFLANFWVFDEYDYSSAAFVSLFFYSSLVEKGYNFKVNGYSVRCIKE